MTSRNESALAMKLVAGPKTARTRPASIGPHARAPVNWTEFRRTAPSNASRGTSWGTNDCHDAMFTPDAAPYTRRCASRIHGVAAPDTHTAHNENATIICTVWVISTIVRREKRSASEPAHGPTASAGKKFANAAMPSHVPECVIR